MRSLGVRGDPYEELGCRDPWEYGYIGGVPSSEDRMMESMTSSSTRRFRA